MQFHEWTMAKTVGIALLDLIYQDIIFSIKFKVTANEWYHTYSFFS